MKNIYILIMFITAHGGMTARAGEARWITLDGKAPAVPLVADPSNDRINKVETAQLMLFTTAKKPSLGTILLSPGGGYVRLAINKEGNPVTPILTDAGWDVAILLYHVNAGPNTKPLALADAREALALLKKRGPEFGMSTKRIGGMGFSAGGHLTARLAHETAAAGGLDFMVLMYPAYLEQKGTLLDEVTPPAIPTLVYVAADDGYKPSSVAFDAYCRDHQLKCEFHLAPSGGHGFGHQLPLPPGVKDWPDKLRAFLHKVATAP